MGVLGCLLWGREGLKKKVLGGCQLRPQDCSNSRGLQRAICHVSREKIVVQAVLILQSPSLAFPRMIEYNIHLTNPEQLVHTGRSWWWFFLISVCPALNILSGISWILSSEWGASLVAQWLRICLPMQGTRVQALVQEDPTCRGAAKPVCHNYWAHMPQLLSLRSRARAPQLLKPVHHSYWSLRA